jgi:RNA polymerase sigma-70 factor (ECF subfamily)
VHLTPLRRLARISNHLSSAAAVPPARPMSDDGVNEDERDDDALMRAYAQGDARAFGQLYARHHAALYRFVRRVLGQSNIAQADEVFQEAWLRVVRARQQWSPRGATFRTWLFTLAHHCAIDVLRKSGREVSLDAEEDHSAPWQPQAPLWQGWPAAGADAVEDSAFWRAAGVRLLNCLEALPPAQRGAFLLHHEDGLSLADLAAALEVGFETAKSRLRYAVSKLRTCMGAYLPTQSLP